MSDFNPFQDRPFCGGDDLKFFIDMAPRRKLLTQFSSGVLNQGTVGACAGYGSKTLLDIFCKARGLPLALSWSFIYWIARRLEQDPFFGADTGVSDAASIFKALYLSGAALQSLMPNESSANGPSDAAFADAATRKLTLFERMDIFDYRNAVVTALAHDIPVGVRMHVTYTFMGIQSTDPVEQMAQFNLPGGRIGPGFPDYDGQHWLPIVGYDLDLDCVFVQNSLGLQWCVAGVGAISFATLAAQTIQAYAPREFAGLTSPVDPKYVVAANARHNSAAMLNIRRFVVNLFAGTTMPPLVKSQTLRGAMAVYSVSSQDVADAVAPWGIDLPTVDAFLALSAP